ADFARTSDTTLRIVRSEVVECARPGEVPAHAWSADDAGCDGVATGRCVLQGCRPDQRHQRSLRGRVERLPGRSGQTQARGDEDARSARSHDVRKCPKEPERVVEVDLELLTQVLVGAVSNLAEARQPDDVDEAVD